MKSIYFYIKSMTSKFRLNILIVCFLILVSVLFVSLYSNYKIKKRYQLRTKERTAVEDPQYRPQLAYQGVTIFPEQDSSKIVLVDMLGKVRKYWDFDAHRFRLLKNCNFLVVAGKGKGRRDKSRKFVKEYTWEGKEVWSYKAPGIVHHDIQKLGNENIIFPFYKKVPKSYLSQIEIKIRRNAEHREDIIYEIDKSGDIVWSWSYLDNFNINMCGTQACEQKKTKVNLLDWTHTNTVNILPSNKWYDLGDERFKPGNVILMPRNWSEILIIDKESKKVVWSYKGDYKDGLIGGHEPHMIPKGLPGAGNILVFDNGYDGYNNFYGDNLFYRSNGASFVLEFDPVSKKTIWVYDVGKGFYSHSAGSIQRLPNGNTLVSSDVKGRVFEVTKGKKIVWQYKNKNMTQRAKRYSYEYCSQLEQFRNLEFKPNLRHIMNK